MIRLKRQSRIHPTVHAFENLVDYDKVKTKMRAARHWKEFENLVDYDKAKTRGRESLHGRAFENLVDYDKAEVSIIPLQA